MSTAANEFNLLNLRATLLKGSIEFLRISLDYLDSFQWNFTGSTSIIWVL